MENATSWIATAATIFAACLTASNLGSRITGYGFAVFTIGSIAWLAVGIQTGQPALVWTNVVMTLLNLFGIWRWLGRQAKVEEGGRVATNRSRRSDGPSLFPASLFTSGKITDTCNEDMAQSVDAMLDVRTGQPVYLVISHGGIGSVGETLRRLPWSEVSVFEDRFQTCLVESELVAYEEIDPKDWPRR